MRLASRPEILLNPEMDLERSALEPAAPALRKVGRFTNLWNAQCALIERASIGLAPWRHRQLHMVERYDRHAHLPFRTVYVLLIFSRVALINLLVTRPSA